MGFLDLVLGFGGGRGVVGKMGRVGASSKVGV